jgi:carboxylesterase type B
MSDETNELLPVAVWLHGGGFMYGTTGDPMYDGREYAVKHNTVLVTLNYRLGALGFLATPNSGGKS